MKKILYNIGLMALLLFCGGCASILYHSAASENSFLKPRPFGGATALDWSAITGWSSDLPVAWRLAFAGVGVVDLPFSITRDILFFSQDSLRFKRLDIRFNLVENDVISVRKKLIYPPPGDRQASEYYGDLLAIAMAYDSYESFCVVVDFIRVNRLPVNLRLVPLTGAPSIFDRNILSHSTLRYLHYVADNLPVKRRDFDRWLRLYCFEPIWCCSAPDLPETIAFLLEHGADPDQMLSLHGELLCPLSEYVYKNTWYPVETGEAVNSIFDNYRR